MSDIQSQKSEMGVELRAACVKFETDLKSLQVELDEEREKSNELDTILKEKEQAY